MNKTFNVYLLKYLLSEDVITALKSTGSITDVRWQSTCHPDDPINFFQYMTASDQDSYNKFAAEAVRIEVHTANAWHLYYLFFRTGKEDRPDLGAHKYTFARPSSVEVGYVDSKGGFVRLDPKIHYTDIFVNGFTCADDAEVVRLTKNCEYSIMNILIDQVNKDFSLNIPHKLLQ